MGERLGAFSTFLMRQVQQNLSFFSLSERYFLMMSTLLKPLTSNTLKFLNQRQISSSIFLSTSSSFSARTNWLQLDRSSPRSTTSSSLNSSEVIQRPMLLAITVKVSPSSSRMMRSLMWLSCLSLSKMSLASWTKQSSKSFSFMSSLVWATLLTNLAGRRWFLLLSRFSFISSKRFLASLYFSSRLSLLRSISILWLRLLLSTQNFMRSWISMFLEEKSNMSQMETSQGSMKAQLASTSSSGFCSSLNILPSFQNFSYRSQLSRKLQEVLEWYWLSSSSLCLKAQRQVSTGPLLISLAVPWPKSFSSASPLMREQNQTSLRSSNQGVSIILTCLKVSGISFYYRSRSLFSSREMFQPCLNFRCRSYFFTERASGLWAWPVRLNLWLNCTEGSSWQPTSQCWKWYQLSREMTFLQMAFEKSDLSYCSRLRSSFSLWQLLSSERMPSLSMNFSGFQRFRKRCWMSKAYGKQPLLWDSFFIYISNYNNNKQTP